MLLNIEDRAERARKLLARPDIQDLMRLRCDEQSHDWENCCSAMFAVYMRCKWCGSRA